MTAIAQFLVDRWDRLRMGSRSQWVWRLALIAVLAASVITTWAWAPWPFAPALLVLALGLALGAVWDPDSLAVGGFITTTIGWWLVAGRPEQSWQPVVAAVVLLVIHLLAAGTGSAPFWARWSRAAVGSWGRSAVAMVALAGIALAATLAVAAIPVGVVPRGPVWIAAALATILGASLWASRR